MSESVILNSPLLLALYGLALALCLFDLRKRTGFVLPLISAVIAVATSAYALLSGAGLFETATCLMLFLLVNLGNIGRKGK